MTAAPPRRCLILDLDGVLVDSEPLHFESWQQAFEQLMGIRITGDHHRLVGLTQEQIYQLWVGGSADDLKRLTPAMRQRLLMHKTQVFFHLAAGLRPMPGSLELLRRAHAAGWYTALVSRALRKRLHHTLALIQMPALFDLILANEDALDALTDRKVHARAAHILKCDPADCIVIEDSLSGITDALACGIGHVVGLTSSLDASRLGLAGAHEVVEHLSAVQLPEARV